MSRTIIEDAKSMYGVDGWGQEYFDINKNGHLCVTPLPESEHKVDLMDVVTAARTESIATPLIIRFPQIVAHQIKKLHVAFRNAIWEYSYKARHRGVFPFKVNQNREFIDLVVEAGKTWHYGLEVGSKPELLAAMAYELSPEALLVCNGFKDEEFVELAFIAKKLGKNVVIVAEGLDELAIYHEVAARYDAAPNVGIRFKLYSKGQGKWVKSSGESSKFGLTTSEVLSCLDFLRRHGYQDKLAMLHFHIGSQITAIKRIKNAIKEAARVYSKIYQMGYRDLCLNIGGGIGVDYDGSKTSADSSANYSLQEYANTVVYEIGEVCRYEGVPCPDIVNEGGRIIAAYHAMVITDIREVQQATETGLFDKVDRENSHYHNMVMELLYIKEHLSEKNYVEYYHDAVDYYEEMFSLFNHGFISLEERGIGEQCYNLICSKALEFAMREKHPRDEFIALQGRLVGMYLANFSMFQSIPDAWSIDQLFPVMPLSLLHTRTNHKAKVVDITCDSDGCLERFVDRTSNRSVLDLHIPPADQDYYIGFFLTGAYQESLSNQHNLFGSIDEIEVLVDPDSGTWRIADVHKGETCSQILTGRKFFAEELLRAYDQALGTKMQDDLKKEIKEKLEACLDASPYLQPNRHKKAP